MARLYDVSEPTVSRIVAEHPELSDMNMSEARTLPEQSTSAARS